MKKTLSLLLIAFLTIATSIWFFSPTRNSSLLVTWTDSAIPMIEATVDGQKILLRIDTSGKFLLSLNNQGLDCLADKTPKGTATWHDRLGNLYESSSYCVKTFSVGQLQLSDVLAQRTDEKDEQGKVLWEGAHSGQIRKKTAVGTIGRPILLQTNLLLDLGHDRIILIKSKKGLKKYGVALDAMKKFALEPDERGIILRTDTVIGPLRFLINSGSTFSFVRSSLVTQSAEHSKRVQKDCRGLPYFVTNARIGSTELGWQKMYLLDLTDEITWAEGCLGVDFLDKHMLYIDYPNKTVYIS